MKKSIAIILCIMLVFAITIQAAAIKTIAVKSIKLNKTSISLSVGQTANLNATLTPANTTQKLLKYSSSNNKVVTIDSKGKITAVGMGSAVITVTSSLNKNINAKCKVAVTKLFSKPTTLTLTTPLFAGQEMSANLYIIQMIKAKTNVFLNVNTIPWEVYDDKLNVLLNTGQVSDIVYTGMSAMVNKFGNAGIFENIKLHVDEMPNFKKFFNDPKLKSYLSYYKNAEGDMYICPQIGRGDSERVGWLYRADIFEKNNIKVPTNDVELYDALKKLKQIYPKSSPLIFRNGVYRIAYMAESFGSSAGYYLNPQLKKWSYGPIEDNFKACAEYMNRLYKEELLPANIMTLSKSGWTQMMSNKEDAFMTYDYLGRIDSYYDSVKAQIPDYKLRYMPPPKMGKNGNNNNFSLTTLCTIGNCLSSTSKNLDAAIKYHDWLYSDEGSDLVSWGEEGVIYKVENGDRKYIAPRALENPLNDLTAKYGLWTDGFFTRLDADSYQARGTATLRAAVAESKKYDAPIPPNVLFTESETEQNATLLTTVDTYMFEQVSKFILGTRPFSEWDKYVKDIKDLGLQKLLDTYNTAYARMKN